MSRAFWKSDELEALEKHADDWLAFHALFPERSYDSFEVKRRRLETGSAGTKDLAREKVRDLRAMTALRVLAEYIGARRVR